jgi:hypothetical protein
MEAQHVNEGLAEQSGEQPAQPGEQPKPKRRRRAAGKTATPRTRTHSKKVFLVEVLQHVDIPAEGKVEIWRAVDTGADGGFSGTKKAIEAALDAQLHGKFRVICVTKEFSTTQKVVLAE